MKMPEEIAGHPAQRTYSYDDVEAAMCVWEWLLEGSGSKPNPGIVELFENYGYGGMRCAAAQAALIIEGWWRYTQELDLPCGIGEDPFDWHFVLDACSIIDWPVLVSNNQHGDGGFTGQSNEDAIAAMIAMKALAA